jgi:hypothetical protein
MQLFKSLCTKNESIKWHLDCNELMLHIDAQLQK